jgi:hypothetical protein
MTTETSLKHVCFLAGLFLLGSCGREQHDVEVQVSNGLPIFNAKGTVGFWHNLPCLSMFQIQDENRRMIWRIIRDGKVDCEKSSGFPIRYGIVPHDFRQVGPILTIERSKTYIITGDDYRNSTAYSGGFRIGADGTKAITLKWNSWLIQKIFGKWADADRLPSGS